MRRRDRFATAQLRSADIQRYQVMLMGFDAYGSYDGLGLAALVAKKKVKPSRVDRSRHRTRRSGQSKDQCHHLQGLWPRTRRGQKQTSQGCVYRCSLFAERHRCAGSRSAVAPGVAFPSGVPAARRQLSRAEVQGDRIEPLRRDERAGIRTRRVYRVQALWHSEQSVEPRALAGRIVRRFCGCGRRRHRSARPRQ